MRATHCLEAEGIRSLAELVGRKAQLEARLRDFERARGYRP